MIPLWDQSREMGNTGSTAFATLPIIYFLFFSYSSFLLFLVSFSWRFRGKWCTLARLVLLLSSFFLFLSLPLFSSSFSLSLLFCLFRGVEYMTNHLTGGPPVSSPASASLQTTVYIERELFSTRNSNCLPTSTAAPAHERQPSGASGRARAGRCPRARTGRPRRGAAAVRPSS